MTAPDAKPLRLRDQLIRSFAGVGALRALSMPISLVVSIILARSLGPDGFGQYAFIMALVPLLALPAAGGLPQLLTREVAKIVHGRAWQLYRGIWRFAYGWVFVYSVVAVAAVALVVNSWPVAAGRWQLLPLAMLLVPLTGLLGITRGLSKGLGHVAMAELPTQFVRPAAFLAVITVVALAGPMTAGQAIGGQLVAAGIGFVAGAFLLARQQPAAELRVPAEYATSAWSRALLPMTLVAVVSTLNSQVGIVLLGFMDTNASVAAFQIADRGAKLVMLSLVLVNMVIAPQIVKFRMAEDRASLQLLSRQSARAALALGLPVAIAFFVMGESIIRWLYGAEYAAAVYAPLVIMAAGHVVNVFFGSVGLLLTMSDQELVTLRKQLVALVVNAAACVLLIPRYGATGAALGSVAGLVLWNILLAVQVQRRLGIRPTAL